MSHPRTQQNCVSHGSKPDESIQVSSALTRARPFTSWLMLTKVLMFLLLTNASQSGGWVPETSRCFHYWQPAPRWRLLPWLANPGNPAMIPHVEKQAPVTLIRQWKERKGQGRGDSLQGVPMLRRNANAQKNANTSTNRYDAQRSKNTRNPGTCAYLANR